jgi:flagellar FliL protein
MADAKKGETEAEAPPAKSKGKLMLFIIIGVLVLVLAGGGAAYFLLKKKPVDESADGEETSSEVHAKKKDKKADHSPPSFHKFDKPFTVKLQTEQQEAYLQAEVQFRVLDAAALEMLKQYDPELKHRIMLILLTKKASELGSAQGVQRLSNEIREVVNATLEPSTGKKGKEKAEAKEPREPSDVVAPDAPVQAVLFTSFIIQ